MTKTAKHTSIATLAAIIAGIVILLIPAVRCWLSNRAIARLDSEIRDVQQDNKARQRTIEQLHAAKTSELVGAVESLNDLEHRVTRNRKLADDTEEAQKKLTLVKTLIERHLLIRTEVRAIMERFPELLSAGD